MSIPGKDWEMSILMNRWLSAKTNIVPALFLSALISHLVIIIAKLIYCRWNIQALQTGDLSCYFGITNMIATGVHPIDPWADHFFPGWSWLLLPVVGSYPQPLLPILIACILYAFTPVLFYAITKDVYGAWFLVAGTPALISATVGGLNEPAYLFFCLFAWFLFGKQQFLYSGISIGAAACIRPTAVFLLLAFFLVLLKERKFTGLVISGVFASLVVSVLIVFNLYFFHDPLHQLHSYSSIPNVPTEIKQQLGLGAAGGSHLSFIPFVNFVKTSLLKEAPLIKQIYIWSHAVVMLAILVIGFRRYRQLGDNGLIALTWAVLNSLFISCGGDYWGFHGFDRYFTWALPAYVLLVNNFLPKRPLTIAATVLLMLLGGFWVSIRHS